MPEFLFLTVACLATGALFAVLAVWLSTRHGNTIAEVLDAQQHLGAGEALNLEVMNRFRVATSVPIVALYVIAAICAFALPATFIYFNRLQTPLLQVTGSVDAHPAELMITTAAFGTTGNAFNFSLPVTATQQHFDIYAGTRFAPMTLYFEVEGPTKRVRYSYDETQHWHTSDIDDSGSVSLPALHLTPIGTQVSNSP